MSTTGYEHITSSKNQHIQHVRELLAKRSTRDNSGLFVLEGVRLCEEALRSGLQPQMVIFSDKCSFRGLELVQKSAKYGSRVYLVPEEILDGLAETETTQGILMVMEKQPTAIPDELDFVVIVDQLRDPGNLGTILRSAVAADAQAVFITPGSVDAWSPKVVRSAMGAHFHIPITTMTWDDIVKLCKHREGPLTLFLAESGDGLSLWNADLRQPLALVIGGEADGASAAARADVDLLLNIPMPGGFESLNAAVAASIILFEVVRQRS